LYNGDSMKKFIIKELNAFLEIADQIETPLKFFMPQGDTMEAIVHMRTFLLAWEGEQGEERIELLKEHGFKEAQVVETKKFSLEDLL